MLIGKLCLKCGYRSSSRNLAKTFFSLKRYELFGLYAKYTCKFLLIHTISIIWRNVQSLTGTPIVLTQSFSHHNQNRCTFLYSKHLYTLYLLTLYLFIHRISFVSVMLAFVFPSAWAIRAGAFLSSLWRTRTFQVDYNQKFVKISQRSHFCTGLVSS